MLDQDRDSATEPGDRVLCVNDDVSKSVFGMPREDFVFPNGFVRKGDVYFVREVRKAEHGTWSLVLLDLPVFYQETEVGWNSLRFRRIYRQSHEMKREAEAPLKVADAISGD